MPCNRTELIHTFVCIAYVLNSWTLHYINEQVLPNRSLGSPLHTLESIQELWMDLWVQIFTYLSMDEHHKSIYHAEAVQTKPTILICCRLQRVLTWLHILYNCQQDMCISLCSLWYVRNITTITTNLLLLLLHLKNQDYSWQSQELPLKSFGPSILWDLVSLYVGIYS